MLDTETRTIFSIVSNDYSAIKSIDLSCVNCMNLIMRASANKVLYIFAKNTLNIPSLKGQLPQHIVGNLNAIIKRGDEELCRLKNTIEFVKSIFSDNDIPFLIIKTYKDIPYITYDLDVMVNRDQFKLAQEKVLESKMYNESPQLSTSRKPIVSLLHTALVKALTINLKGHEEGETGLVPAMNSLLTVDLHYDFIVRGLKCIDYASIWENQRDVEFLGVKFPTPSLETEMLINVAHMIYELWHISLLDFIFIKRECDKVNWIACLEEAGRHRWEKAFSRFISIIEELNNELCPGDQPLTPFSHSLRESKSLRKAHIGMPHLFDFPFMLKVFYDNIKIASTIPIFDVLYYLLIKMRYISSKRNIIPMYHHWSWWASTIYGKNRPK